MQSQSNDKNLIKIRAYHQCTLFPKMPLVLGEGENNFGITKWDVVEILEGEVGNYNVCIKGDFYETLKPGVIYTILAQRDDHPVYGEQYILIYINEEIDLNNLVNQKAFLETFLTPGQITELYKIHPNPLKIIEEHNIPELTKVHGIGDYIANCIIERFEEKKDLSVVYSELADYGLTPNFIRKLVRAYKNTSRIIEVVKNDPYSLVYDVEGVGFKTADNIALIGGINPRAKERLAAYIINYLNEEASEKGNSYVIASELVLNIYNYFGSKDDILEVYYDEEGNTTGTNLSEAINLLVSSEKIIVEENENKSNRRVYLKYYYELEQQIANHIKRLLNSENTFNYPNWEKAIEELEDKQGFKFAKEQLEGIKLGLDSQVCLICGLAGVGKSTLVSGILASIENCTFAQCALSGKAAARLQEVTGAAGSTIHRLLGYNPSFGSEDPFVYNEKNPLPYDIIILDEVSMVGGEIFLSLLKAIPNGSKLIMLGDLGQLESIGALNLAADFYNSTIIPTVELKEIHRQAAKSGIITCAHEVRNNHQLFSKTNCEETRVFGELEDMTFDMFNEKDNIRKRTLQWFKKWYNSDLVGQDIMKIQVICPIKERGEACVYNLNNDIQAIVNPDEDGSDIFDIFGNDSREEIICGSRNKPYHIHKNDKVMCIKNNYRTVNLEGEVCPIFNGWTGIVTHIESNDIYVDFPLAGGEIRLSYKEAAGSLMLGYVTTVHKCQGSDTPVVIGALDYSTPPMMLTSQLLYTLITRAKKHCVVVAQTGALAKAIDTDYVSQKRTFLKEFLDEKE